MFPINRLRRSIALAVVLAGAATAQAAPPWLEGWRAVRVVDASGRTVPRVDPNANDARRITLRPNYAANLLLLAKPMYLAGYAGATYGPRRGYDPTSYSSRAHAHGHATGARSAGR